MIKLSYIDMGGSFMIKVQIESINITFEDKEYNYSYFLTRNIETDKSSMKLNTYGIEVLCSGVNNDYFESEHIKNLASSKSFVLKIINYLIEKKVSPVHMVDILSDKIEEETEYVLLMNKCL